MRPEALRASHFAKYGVEARRVATGHLELLRRLPLVFLPLLLREVIAYDYLFPAERRQVDDTLLVLNSLTPARLTELMKELAAIRVSREIERIDWVDSPGDFLDALSTALWATHQIDSFTTAAGRYAENIRKSITEQAPATAPLAIVIIGRDVGDYASPLFAKLRPSGTILSNVKAPDGVDVILNTLAKRAERFPAPYSHWHVDGLAPTRKIPGVATVSYQELEVPRTRLLGMITDNIRNERAGPERVRTLMAQLRPEQIGLGAEDRILGRFKLSLLTEGSGTQVFSTTFVQWAAREVLRRAQPSTLVVRFAPRQRPRSLDEMLSNDSVQTGVDPVGALIDADMAAYYVWLGQRRLSQSAASSFLVWFEGHSLALASGPSFSPGTRSSVAVDLQSVIDKLTRA